MATMTRSIPGFWSAEGTKVRGKAIELLMGLAFIVPAYDLHSSVSVGTQHFDHGASPLAATQNIDALAKHWKADDPLIGPTPGDEKYGKKGDACNQYKWTYLEIRE